MGVGLRDNHHTTVINPGYGALQHIRGSVMRSVMKLLAMASLGALATPATAIVVINQPVRPPSACFEGVSDCTLAPVPQPVTTASAPIPEPMVAVVVGLMALGLAFGRRSGLQEVVS